MRHAPASLWRQAGGGLVLLLFGGVFLYFLLPELYANLTATRWMPSSCRILSSTISTTESGEGIDRQTLYRLDVRYTYEVSGLQHESTRYRFVNPFTENQAAAETAAARYSPGATVPCYINPADPPQAVLERHLSPFMLIAILPAAIAGLGLWTMIDAAARGIGR